MNPVIHFEMPADDPKRMSQFYAKCFGWDTMQMGPEMGNYVTVSTSETDEMGRPKTPGAINGGFYPRRKDATGDAPSVVIAVDDIHASMKEIDAAGGQLLGEPVEIPGVGTYISFHDTEGNRVSLLQPVWANGQ